MPFGNGDRKKPRIAATPLHSTLMNNGHNTLPDGLELLHQVCKEHSVAFMTLIAKTCRWVDPKTFKLMAVWYPEACRGAEAFDSKYEQQYKSSSGKLRTHHNEKARESLRQAMGLSRGCLNKNWVACHIWGIDDPGSS
ncbi:MAG: hypothetical protein DMG97_09380, partial [Acidobacteria bacterium]